MEYPQVLQPLFNTLWYLIPLPTLAAAINTLVQRQCLMGLGIEQVHSLVVFVGNSTSKTLMPESVTYGCGYIRFIKAQVPSGRAAVGV